MWRSIRRSGSLMASAMDLGGSSGTRRRRPKSPIAYRSRHPGTGAWAADGRSSGRAGTTLMPSAVGSIYSSPSLSATLRRAPRTQHLRSVGVWHEPGPRPASRLGSIPSPRSAGCARTIRSGEPAGSGPSSPGAEHLAKRQVQVLEKLTGAPGLSSSAAWSSASGSPRSFTPSKRGRPSSSARLFIIGPSSGETFRGDPAELKPGRTAA